jgi:hypothetical protein
MDGRGLERAFLFIVSEWRLGTRKNNHMIIGLEFGVCPISRSREGED